MWLGWFGFIAGSAYKANNHAGMSFLNTQIASGVGSLAWIAVDIFQSGRPSIIGIVNGTLSGLVAITPAAGYVDTTASFIIGFCGGFLCCLGVRIKTIFQFDDALDAFGIHGIGGVVGTFLTGCFAHHKYQAEAGAFYGSPGQLKVQVYCILFTVAWSTILSFCIFWLVDVLIGLRVSVDVEKLGLDRMEHGSSMYSQLRNIPKRRLRQSSSNEVARQPQQQHQQQQLNVTKFFSSIFSTLSSHPQNDNTDLEHSSDFGSLDSDRLSGRENLAIVHVSGQASTELTNISNKQGKSAETKCEDF